MKNLNAILEKHARWMFSIFMISMSLFIVSCNNDDDDMNPPCENIVEIAQSAPDLSTLRSAIVAADLTEVLSEGGPFTVFAPTNEAFAKLDPQVLNNIISTPSLLTALLQYHVVSGKVSSSQLSNGSVATLLSGQSINVDISGGMVTLNGSSKVITADIEACNGIIHIIDEVLLPADFAPQTIVQIAASNPETFSELVKALSKPELSDLLAAANDPMSDLTVFAPTNDAFAAVLSALGKKSIDDLPIGLLKEIVQYHIVGGATMSTELTNGLLPTLLPNENLTVDVGNVVMINDAEVIAADIKAINGVIHAIDGVLLPSYASAAVGTISEVIVFDTDYTILVAALKKAELLETVSEADNLTLFAPDNAAFVAAGITSLEGLDKEVLTPILLYHVIGAKVLSSQLPADGMVTTLSSDQMMYLGYLNDGVVLINGLTKITAVDIEKSNGVVHTINRTLVPPADDVVDIAVALADMGDDSEFTVLVSLLASDDFSGITQALKDAENVTVFAPTDAAFGDISDTIEGLTTEQIANVLTYHAAPARVFSSQLVDGQSIGMLNQETVTVNIADGMVSITDKSGGEDAKVIEVNIQGSNGVIHVVDKVLIPTL